jgi:hypothetical protein
LQKLNAETVKLKGDAEKFAKDASDAAAKAVAAEKIATQAKANADQAAFESARLKTDNERLTRELATVRELAELIRSQAGTGTVTIKPDPSKLADRFFADGVRSFHAAVHSRGVGIP